METNRFDDAWRLSRAVLAGVLALGLGGCAAAGIGAATAGGMAVAQERSVEDAARDAAIEASVARTLFDMDRTLYSRVDIAVVEGRVALTGTVRSQDQRIEAARAAWSVDKVKEVQNEIQVADAGGPVRYMKDSLITTKVKAALFDDGAIKGRNYSVETVRGVVYLIGIAEDEAELEKAKARTARVGGVKRVVSLMRFKTDPRRLE